MKTLLLYIITTPLFFLIDLVWLGVISKKFYATYIGTIMRDTVVIPAVFLFYIFYGIGLLYFAVMPALASGSWTLAALNGAVFGFMAYMTYDLTNLAVLKNFSWQIVPVDILWGTVLTAGVAVLSFFIGRMIF
jgi:uncharacterized membrane protein